MRKMLGPYTHTAVMGVIFIFIWVVTTNTGAFIALVGAEMMSIQHHQERYHPGLLFDRVSVFRVGMATLLCGLLFGVMRMSYMDFLCRSLLVISSQGFSVGWHLYQHPEEDDVRVTSYMFLGGVCLVLWTGVTLIVGTPF